MRDFLFLGLSAMVLFFSKAAMSSALNAARVFAEGVLPALFPMMVLSRLTPLPPKGERSFLMERTVLFALAAGSPTAAQRVCRLWEGGRIPEDGLEPLLCMTGVMSPMFFTGTLASWTGQRTECWLLLGVHWLSALLCGGLWRRLVRPCAQRTETADACPRTTLPEAIGQSAQSMLAVCGAMMTFSIAAGLMRETLAHLLPAWTQAHPRTLAVGWALMEIGGGARAVLDAFSVPPLALLCALCSFGGLSIWLQNLLFAGDKISPAKLLGMRALHGAVAYLLCAGFLKIQNLLIT